MTKDDENRQYLIRLNYFWNTESHDKRFEHHCSQGNSNRFSEKAFFLFVFFSSSSAASANRICVCYLYDKEKKLNSF